MPAGWNLCVRLTPQGPAHLGHMRGAVAYDAIRRWLKFIGYDVTMVQNFTDIDDKIINKAAEENVPASEIAARFGALYLADWDSLGIERIQFVKVPRIWTRSSRWSKSWSTTAMPMQSRAAMSICRFRRSRTMANCPDALPMRWKRARG